MVEELKAAVARARKADATADECHGEVKRLLVEVRRLKPDMSLPDIEIEIERYYDRASISRFTAPALGLSKKTADA